jgi:hypothetical protein
MNGIRLGQLAPDENNESVRIKPLSRLRRLLIHLTDNYNETGMNIQSELYYPGASARVCLCYLISTHNADSLAPRAPLVRPHVI